MDSICAAFELQMLEITFYASEREKIKNNSIALDVHSNNKELAHPTSESTINPLFIFCDLFSSLLLYAVSPPEMRE